MPPTAGVLRTASAGLLALGLATPVQAGNPRIDYMLECQGCHLPDGRGAPPAVPTLTDTVGNFLAVPGGREYLVRVPGSSQSRLSDAELAEVLNWMIREFGPAERAADFTPFSAAEVARYRDEPLTEVDAVRRELVGRFP